MVNFLLVESKPILSPLLILSKSIVNPPMSPLVALILPLRSTFDAVILPFIKWKLDELISIPPPEALINAPVPCPKNIFGDSISTSEPLIVAFVVFISKLSPLNWIYLLAPALVIKSPSPSA